MFEDTTTFEWLLLAALILFVLGSFAFERSLKAAAFGCGVAGGIGVAAPEIDPSMLLLIAAALSLVLALTAHAGDGEFGLWTALFHGDGGDGGDGGD